MLFNPLQHREKVNEKNSSNAAQRLVMTGQQQRSSPSAEKDYVLIDKATHANAEQNGSGSRRGHSHTTTQTTWNCLVLKRTSATFWREGWETRV